MKTLKFTKKFAKVFTQKDFETRFNLCFKCLTGEDNIYPVKISKRMTRGLGKVTIQSKFKPMERKKTWTTLHFTFSDTLLAGLYTLDCVDQILMHEIIHHICLHKYNADCGHGYMFKRECRLLNCTLDGTSATLEQAEDYDKVATKYFKHVATCSGCGHMSYFNSDKKAREIKDKIWIHHCSQFDKELYTLIR